MTRSFGYHDFQRHAAYHSSLHWQVCKSAQDGFCGSDVGVRCSGIMHVEYIRVCLHLLLDGLILLDYYWRSAISLRLICQDRIVLTIPIGDRSLPIHPFLTLLSILEYILQYVLCPYRTLTSGGAQARFRAIRGDHRSVQVELRAGWGSE